MGGMGFSHSPAPGGRGAGWPAQPPGMTIGQILDRVFRLIGANLRMYLGMALVPAGASLGMMTILGGLALLILLPRLHGMAHLHGMPHPADFLSLLVLLPLAFLLYCGVFVVFALYGTAAAHAVVKTHRGEPASAAEAWAIARKGAGRYIWLMFLLALILAGPVYVVMGIFGSIFAVFALSIAHNHAAAQMAFATFIPLAMLFNVLNLGGQVYMVLMFLRYGLAIPACVMESLPAVESLKRSVTLTRGGRGRFFVAMLTIYAASIGVVLACELVLFFVAGIAVLAGTLMHLTLHSPALLFFFAPAALLVVMALMLAVFSLPYVGYTTVVGVVYCDQCWRLENTAPTPVPGGLA
jgi:hypothetical protein